MPVNKANGQRRKWRSLGKREKKTAIAKNTEKWYTCNMCNNRVKYAITLKKHINGQNI